MILISNTDDTSRQFKVILNAHLDVVPAGKYQLVEKEGKFYGRGAYDMKIAAAVMILLFKELAKSVDYPLALQLVTDEEMGGFHGTKYQVEQGVSGEFVIAGDISDLKVQNKSKGMLWIKIKANGKSAHGAYPWEGENALEKLQRGLEKLKMLYPDPEEAVWRTTINIAKIEKPNVAFTAVREKIEPRSLMSFKQLPALEYQVLYSRSDGTNQKHHRQSRSPLQLQELHTRPHGFVRQCFAEQSSFWKQPLQWETNLENKRARTLTGTLSLR